MGCFDKEMEHFDEEDEDIAMKHLDAEMKHFWRKTRTMKCSIWTRR